MQKGIQTITKSILIVLSSFGLYTTNVQAQSTGITLGEMAESLTSQLGNIGRLAIAGGAVLGIIMLATGLLKLKAAAESNGSSTKYSEGIWRVAIGAALLAIPAFTGMLQATFGFGEGATLTEGGGQSF